MPTLTRYVSRVFLAHLVLMLVGFVTLVQLFDLLNNAGGLFKRHGDGTMVLLRYAGLRLPEIVTSLVPFSVLMASLMSLARLALHNEVLALKAAGLSYYRLLVSFVPALLCVAALHLALADQLAPAASRSLAEWEAAAMALDPEVIERGPVDTSIWVRNGPTIVRVGQVLDDGRELRDLTLFRRDEDGNLVDRITAAYALHRHGGWQLRETERFSISERPGGELVRAPEMNWETDLLPDHFADLQAPPGSLSMRELIGFLSEAGVGNHPSYWYDTLLQKRIALPVTSFLMLLLAAPVAQALQRYGGMGGALVVGISLGFLYFVTDGLGLALGQVGAIPPLLAAWLAPMLFASVGATTLLRLEGH